MKRREFLLNVKNDKGEVTDLICRFVLPDIAEVKSFLKI